MVKLMSKPVHNVNIPYTIKYSSGIMQMLLYEMWRRPNLKNDSTFTITFGDTGSGKSWGDIFFAYALDVDKNTDEHRFELDDIKFGLQDFLRGVRHPKRIGGTHIFEEVEIDANSKESFKSETKKLGKTMSIIRSRRQIIFFNLPSENQLAAEIRRLNFGSFEFTGVSLDNSYSNFKFQYVHHPKKADSNFAFHKNVIRNYPRYIERIDQEKDLYRKVKIKNNKLFLPFSDKKFTSLIKGYELKKKKYTDDLLDEFMETHEEVKDKERKMTISDYLSEIDKHKNFFCGEDGKLLVSRLQDRFPTLSTNKTRLIRREFNIVNKKQVQKEDNKIITDIDLLRKKRVQDLQKLVEIGKF